MKHRIFIFILLLVGVSSTQVWSQEGKSAKTTSHTEDGYTYETVEDDPLNARIYTLDNGLEVYLSDYKESPRIQTYIAVRAGSKNDPADATGLAHYLEHILFKGTSKIGTINWGAEKPELDKIEQLFETYRRTTDEEARADIYHQIDSISLVAASHAIANEYDKMLSNIGATGTNAYTFVEQTVYVNNIPANQIEKWAEIEGERFSEVVPRLFHTELEAVYEEKNKGLDNDRRKTWEAMLSGLFKNHTYGTQTTIGTVEHLKNPSITEIKKYFDAYYVPNNIAICISGDIDYTETIKTIEKSFGHLQAKEVPEFEPGVEEEITEPIVKTVYGPDAENIALAFRFGGVSNDYGNDVPDPAYVKLISMLLSNGQAGLIDLNLNQQQKIIGGYSYELTLNDYSAHILGGRPRDGQSLEEVQEHLLTQIEMIKGGEFDEWLMEAVINDYKITRMKQFESNKSRADAFVDAFISNRSWEAYLKEIETLESIEKEDLMAFANERYGDNFVSVLKKTGRDTTIQKVPKPKITPVPVNRDTSSVFYREVMAKPSVAIEPVFLDYDKDIKKLKTKNKIPVNYVHNEENDLFTLHMKWNTGKDADPALSVAAGFMNYLGTSEKSAEDIKKEFFKLGCSYNFSVSDDEFHIVLSGLNENFGEALKLLDEIVSDAKPDQDVLNNKIADILKSRRDKKLSKDAILRSAMPSYAKYGTESSFKNVLSQEELMELKPEELTERISKMKGYDHKVLYYGPKKPKKLTKSLAKNFKLKSKLEEPPSVERFAHKPIDENVVYWVDYDMVQAEVLMLSKCVPFDIELVPVSALFNEYFGGSMGSLVFQEMRESKALAYSVRSRYENASRKGEPNYIVSYIGTQADKIEEAITGLEDLLDNMPHSKSHFKNARQSLRESITSSRITKASKLYNYESALKLGLEHDVRKDMFKAIDNLSLEEIGAFQEKYVKGQPKAILIVGSKNHIDFDALDKFGKVQQLQLDDIFGY
ncbi:insulinase family protein [Cytophagaceae bacterium ABcell3]|nr:insulinase family protein [Cytophagaceae bacterium ABcell3]